MEACCVGRSRTCRNQAGLATGTTSTWASSRGDAENKKKLIEPLPRDVGLLRFLLEPCLAKARVRASTNGKREIHTKTGAGCVGRSGTCRTKFVSQEVRRWSGGKQGKTDKTTPT
jgi:hypothetical protein